MTIIINTCYGGFHVPQALCEQFGLSRYDDIDRTDSRLVDFVLSHGGEYEEECSCLTAVEVPDTCTDWEISEYDGYEDLIYVVNGKICHA